MSLQIWLPLQGDLHNQGLKNIAISQTGTTIVNTGKIGKCYQFGTGTSYIDINKTAMTSCTTEASMCFWLNIITWNSNYATWVQCGQNGDSWANQIFTFLRNSNGSNGIFIISNGSTSSTSSYSTPPLSLNTWYHITCVYKTGHCLIYINGQLYQDYTTSIVPNFAGITGIRLGRGIGGNYQSNCQLNDVRFYDHALSQKEVEEIAKGLVLHYKLDKINKNLFKYNGLNSYNQELQLNNYQNRGSFTQFSNCLTIDPANYLNQKFTISFDAISPNGTTALQLYNSNGNPRYFYYSTTLTSSLGNTWQHFKYTFTNTDRGSSYSAGSHPLEIYMPSQMGGKVRNVKVEFGDIETNWIPYSQTDMETIIYDSSGYSNNGTISESLTATASSPRYGTATQFPGNALIEAEPLPAETKTISVWVSFADTSGSSYRMVLHDKNSGLAIGYYSSSIITYVGSSAGGTGSKVVANLTANTWYHIVVVKTGVTTRDTYINGEKATVASDNWWGGDLNKFNIGGRHISGSYSSYITGKIVDVRAYTTALTEDQIKELYTTSVSIDSSGNIHARELVEL